MNDRELLELAAKAAGIGMCWPDRGFPVTNDFSYLVDGDFVGKLWNPLTDDGDALRLAVKLGHSEMIDLYLGQQSVIVDFDNGVKFVQVHNDDSYAATRRAIVRAAAEIGKGMK